MKPVAYHGNLLLSGTLTGSNATTDNPVRQVADGSINLPYDVSTDVASGVHSGSVLVEMGTPRAPVALSIPKGLLQSGHTLRLFGSDDAAGAGQVEAHAVTFSEETARYFAAVSAAAAKQVWRVMVSGASGLLPAKANEIQLATSGSEFDRSPQVGVNRTKVRQFTRIPVPGGQPFVKRDGPALRRTDYFFLLISGGEIEEARTFVDAVDGGSAFTFFDDMGESYWAELLGAEITENDEAGVSTWRPSFQEIKVEG